MTLRDQIDALPPEQYAREALAAARSAQRRATALGIPIPQDIVDLLAIPEDELAAQRRRAIEAGK